MILEPTRLRMKGITGVVRRGVSGANPESFESRFGVTVWTH